MNIVRHYILNVAVGIDQLVNALIGGSPDETLSSVLGKAQTGWYGRKVQYATMPLRVMVDTVFYFIDGPDHCQRMIEHDEGRESLWNR